MKRNPKFIIRTDTKTLQLQYSHKGVWFRVNSHIKCNVSEWDEEGQKKLGKENKDDNITLASMLNRLRTIIFDHKLKSGDNPTVEHIKNEYFKTRNEISKDKHLVETYTEWLEHKKQLIKDPRHYNTVLNNLTEFSTLKNKQYRFSDLDHDFKDQFIQFQINKGICNHTVRKRMKCFKCFLNEMTTNHKNTNLTFKEWNYKEYTVIKKKKVICLSSDEFETLRNFKFQGPLTYMEGDKEIVYKNGEHLQYYADLYCLGASCGLRYGDLIRLSPKNIVNRNGNNYIETDVRKTDDELLRIPLNDISENILKKYNNNLKRVSNKSINKQLKMIFRILNFNELCYIKTKYGNKSVTVEKPKWDCLSFHSARKTFISLCISSGIPVSNIMGWTNHSDLDVFYGYANMGMGEEESMKKLFK